MESGRSPRLDSLTSLRFFAAASVLADHAQAFFTGYVRLDVFGDTVTLFFILSGFVLTWSSAKTPVGTFYWHRVARIYPLYLLVWFASCLISSHTGLDGTYGLHTSDFFEQLTLTQVWLPNHLNGGFDAPTWTLSVEWFFYLAFPLLVRAAMWLPRWARRLALVACAAVVLIVFFCTTWTPFLYWLTDDCPLFRLPEFLIGIFFALEIRDGLRVPWSVGIGACAACMFWRWDISSATQYSAQQAPTLIGFALLIASAASADVAGRRSLLRWRPLVVLGDCSYGLFLIHWLVFALLEILPSPSPYALLPASSPVLNAALAATIALAISIVVHFAYEAPLNRLLRRLGDHIRTSGVVRRVVLALVVPVAAIAAGCAVAVDAASAGVPAPVQFNTDLGNGINAINGAQYSTAVADFLAAETLEPSNVDAPYDLGIAYADLGNTSAAIGAYFSALAIDPNDTSVLYNLAIELTPSNPTQALTFLQKVIQLDPTSSGAYQRAGQLLESMGETAAGQADLQRAAQLSAGGGS